jgi:hypothetical protein
VYLFAAFVCHRAVDEKEFQIGELVAEGAFGQVQGGRQAVFYRDIFNEDQKAFSRKKLS